MQQLTVDDGSIVKCLLNVLETLTISSADEDFFADVLLQIFESRARSSLLISIAVRRFSTLGDSVLRSFFLTFSVRAASSVC